MKTPKSTNTLIPLHRALPRFRVSAFHVTLLLLALATSLAMAANKTWSGAGNGKWNSSNNWVASVVPVANDSLFFAGTVRLTSNDNNYSNNTAFSGITFNSGAGAFTLGGNSISLNGSITNNSASTQTIDLAMTLLKSSTFDATAGNLTVSKIVSDGGSAFGITKAGENILKLAAANTFTGLTTVSAGTLEYGITNALSSGGVTVSGGNLDIKTFSDTVGAVTLTTGSITGTTGVLTGTSYAFNGTGSASAILGGAATATKTGEGTTTTLSGSNTYTGATTVSAGALNIQNNTALGTSAGGVSVASGAALELQNNITVGAETLTLNGTGVSAGGALRNISGTNTYGGNMTLAGDTRINSDAGLLNLSNAGSLTGSTFGLTVGGAGNTTISRAIATTTGTLTKDGAGKLTLSAANTYTGLTTISAGTLVLGTNGTIAGSLGVNLGTSGSPGTLDVSAKASFTFGANQTVSGFGNINIGNGKTVTVDGAFAPGNSVGQINVTGNLALAGATTMELGGSGGVAGVDFDNTVVTGALTYGGSLAVVSFGGFDLFTAGTYDLFDFATGHSGNFSSVTLGGGALSYDSGLSLWSGSNGSFDYSLALETGDLAISAVPEPTTWGLLAMSLTIVVIFRRRSKCRPGRLPF